MNARMAIYCEHYFALMWHRKFKPNDESAEERLLTELDRNWYKLNDVEIKELEVFLNQVESLKSNVPTRPFKYHYVAVAVNQTASPLKAA